MYRFSELLSAVEFLGAFGDERKKVVLTNHNGGGSNWHLYVGGYYYGSFNLMVGGWRFAGNNLSEPELTTADRDILLDMILESLNEKGRD